MAIAVTPGRDPEETKDDRRAGWIVLAAVLVVAVLFVLWLVRVYA
jgi:hypothetical protein